MPKLSLAARLRLGTPRRKLRFVLCVLGGMHFAAAINEAEL